MVIEITKAIKIAKKRIGSSNNIEISIFVFTRVLDYLLFYGTVKYTNLLDNFNDHVTEV